ncbi:hypothetical protein NEMIN01_1771 [Nematocida minor]|uniref:uncharacterized protein n=1 Tax=Nematocida minor TaxID=1912983 RepID=UPI00221ED606|nr:uncharacterized protein NEMIN01_1771 [Nematocida minor]KAI5191987.1 hypothetical protein NEMIN01_1771 [Nematocida minor]
MNFLKIVCAAVLFAFLIICAISQVFSENTNRFIVNSDYFRSHPKNRAIECYERGISEILKDAQVDYIMDFNLLQISKDNRYVCLNKPLLLAYGEFIKTDETANEYMKKQKEIWQLLAHSSPERSRDAARSKEKTFSKYELKTGIYAHSAISLSNGIQNIDYLSGLKLHTLRNIIVSSNTMFKGALLNQYNSINQKIYIIGKYIKTYREEIEEAHSLIHELYKYSAVPETVANNSQIAKNKNTVLSRCCGDISLARVENENRTAEANPLIGKIAESSNSPINCTTTAASCVNTSDLRLEYLLNSIYIVAAEIKDFLEGSAVYSCLKNSESLNDLVKAHLYSIKLVINVYESADHEYHKTAVSVPSIKSFIKNIKSICNNTLKIITATHERMEDVFTNIYEIGMYDAEPYTKLTEKIKGVVDAVVLNANNFQAKLSSAIRINRMFSNETATDADIIEQRQKREESAIKKFHLNRNASRNKTETVFSENVKIIKKQNEKIDTCIEKIEEKLLTPVEMEVPISTLNRRILSKDIEAIGPQKKNLNVLYMNRYVEENPQMYITCYNSAAEAVEEGIVATDECKYAAGGYPSYNNGLNYKKYYAPANAKEEEEIYKERMGMKMENLADLILKKKEIINSYNSCNDVSPAEMAMIVETMAAVEYLTIPEEIISNFSLQEYEKIMKNTPNNSNILKVENVRKSAQHILYLVKKKFSYKSAEKVHEAFIMPMEMVRDTKSLQDIIDTGMVEKLFSYMDRYHGVAVNRHFMSMAAASINLRKDLITKKRSLGLEWMGTPHISTFLNPRDNYTEYVELFEINMHEFGAQFYSMIGSKIVLSALASNYSAMAIKTIKDLTDMINLSRNIKMGGERRQKTLNKMRENKQNYLKNTITFSKKPAD